MKHFLTFLFFLTILALASTAQVTEEELNEMMNSREIQLENPIVSNFLSIRQIEQNMDFTFPGLGNKVIINQNGTNNNGFINQTGSGIETYLSQTGSSNEANLLSDGNNISVSAKQDGDGNIINTYIKNLDLQSRSALLLQNGNNNRIDLELFGDGVPTGVLSQEVKITQQGNNHVLEASGEDAFAPFEVTQNSGVGGEGMQISISNSYFNFPMKK